MENLTDTVKAELHRLGADLVGFGDLGELPQEVRDGLPIGICVAVKYPPDVICGIAELPTAEYRDWYNKLNEQLHFIVTRGAEFLDALGFRAVAQTRERVGTGEAISSQKIAGTNAFFANGFLPSGKKDSYLNTALPHKTVATRAGIGWIGKCAMLVTQEFGSAVRLGAILTDAPLETATPVNTPKCGTCTACADACPAGAVSGKNWHINITRDEFFDAKKCRDTARERSNRGFGAAGKITICGKCIEICPYTRKYLGRVPT
ncbi:MAG: 4Fe-4S dicluster domain-containing protein [Defluviitaleaceae bacterium]|nr:4Fe-4S dicluster domain-containing protein [Defluviitaleaceae bacterium]